MCSGSGGYSVYGEKFPCETFAMKHDRRGVIAMYNVLSTGLVNSQFLIHTKPRAEADGYQCGFGWVADEESMAVVEQIVGQPRSGLFGWKPRERIFIVGCGVVPGNSSVMGKIPTPLSAPQQQQQNQHAQVYMDVSIRDQPLGRIVVNLFHDTNPLTCALFLQLVTHSHGHGLKNTAFTSGNGVFGSSNSQQSYCIGGVVNDPKGGLSVINERALMSEKLICENYTRKHVEQGLVSMMDCYDAGFVDSRFMIHMEPAPRFDGRHVVFGKVTEQSYPVVEIIIQHACAGVFGRSLNSDVIIFDCGIVV